MYQKPRCTIFDWTTAANIFLLLNIQNIIKIGYLPIFSKKGKFHRCEQIFSRS